MNEFYFKLLVIFLVSLVYLIRRSHTKCSLTKKTFMRNIVIFIILILFLSPFFDFAKMGLPLFFRFFGLILIVFGLLLLYFSHKELKSNWKSGLDVANHNPKKLVTTGPYKYVRHPLYLAGYILIFGFCFFVDNWFFGFVLLFLYLILSRTTSHRLVA